MRRGADAAAARSRQHAPRGAGLDHQGHAERDRWFGRSLHHRTRQCASRLGLGLWRASNAAGTAVALALIAGLGASTWMFFKAEEARANEAALRRQAESREKLSEAVMQVNQGNYEGAARLLEGMEVPPKRPSLDGVSALA